MGSQSRDLNGRAVLQNGTLPILPKKGSDPFNYPTPLIILNSTPQARHSRPDISVVSFLGNIETEHLEMALNHKGALIDLLNEYNKSKGSLQRFNLEREILPANVALEHIRNSIAAELNSRI